jgi:hypothetical protein
MIRLAPVADDSLRVPPRFRAVPWLERERLRFDEETLLFEGSLSQ